MLEEDVREHWHLFPSPCLCHQQLPKEKKYLIPSSAQEDTSLKATLKELPNGFRFLVEYTSLEQKSSVVPCMKFDDSIIVMAETPVKTEIAACDFSNTLKLLERVEIPSIYFSMPLINNENLEIISHYPTNDQQTLQIVMLSKTGQYARITIQRIENRIEIVQNVLADVISQQIVCDCLRSKIVLLQRDDNIVVLKIQTNDETYEDIEINISKILPMEQAKPEATDTEVSDCVLVSNLVRAFSEAPEGIERERVFSEITSLVSREEGDYRKRHIGLMSLKSIYKSCYNDIINKLWKSCRESFELQPYHIIDIKSLEMEQELGHGTFGTVKKAIWHSPKGDKQVAVKVIQQNAQVFDLSDLRGEFVALSLIEHPNIISMHGGGFVQHDMRIHNSTYWFIVMDLMEGNLAQLIHSIYFHNLTFIEKIKIAQQVCSGLIHLHQHKIIHRDIKPENILYSREGRSYLIKIGDLGISKPQTDTILRTVIGTQDYMAPELRRGDAHVEFGEEVDIYSFGILLWELFTGKTAAEFHANFKQASLFKLSASNVRFPTGFPPWLMKIITRCTSQQPQKRFAATEIYRRFIKFLHPTQTTAAKVKKSISSQASFTALEEMKPAAIWLHTRNQTSRKFSISTCNQLEGYYQKFITTTASKFTTNFQDEFVEGDFMIDFNDFRLIEENSKKIIHIHRKRCGGHDLRTLSVKVNCEREKSGNFMITLQGSPEVDCSDVIREVVYYYRNEDEEVLQCTIERWPYYISVPPKEGEWIGIHVHFDTLPQQYVEFALTETQMARSSTLILNKLEELPKFIINTYQDCTNNEFEILESEVFEFARAETTLILENVLQLCASVNTKLSYIEGMKFSIGEGWGGVAYFLWKVAMSDLYPEKTVECLEQAKIIIAICIEKMKNCLSSIGFLSGSSGIFALASAIYHATGDGKTCSEMISNLLSIAKEFIVPSMFKKDLTSGFAGYIVSVLFIVKNVPVPFYDPIQVRGVLHHCFHLICGSADGLVQCDSLRRAQSGTALGLSGILFALLKIPELALGEHQAKIECSLSSLMEELKHGILSILQAGSIWEAVSWSEGISGIVTPFLEAHEVYNEKQYLNAALRGIEKTWSSGIVRSGFTLRNGTLGNVYAFLQVYNATGDSRYLAQAYQFVMSMKDSRVLVQSGYVRRRCFKDDFSLADITQLSLLDGCVGEACLLLDIRQPRHAAFPGFGSDVGCTSALHIQHNGGCFEI